MRGAIFHLPFIPKLIERAVARRIEQQLEHNDLNNSYQSAYRRGHSIETVLLKVHNDIAEVLDEGSMTILIMFDLSAAFHIIDHLIMLKRLEFCFNEKAITCRKWRIKTSQEGLPFGVPSGSVLGPNNYCMYTKLVGEFLNGIILNIIIMSMIHKCT